MESLDQIIIGKGTVTLDYELGSTRVHIRKPDNRDIWHHWEQEFSLIDKITVFFSSGLDSQFSLLLAKKYCPDVTAVTFQYNWENDIVNASDVLLSSSFCKQHNIKHVIEQIDLKEFLDNNLEDVARDYRTPSPQISSQLYGIIKSKYNDRTMMLGGEVPYIGFLDKQAYSAFEWRDPEKVRINVGMYYKSFIGPFTIYGKNSEHTVIRDPFTMSPEIYYLAKLKNLDVLTENNQTINLNKFTTQRSFWYYKQLYYNQYGFDYMYPLKKRTGFESLKTHLASQTGIYNQFDLQYRVPLLDMHEKENWFGSKQYAHDVVNFVSRNQFTGDLPDIIEQIQNYYDSNQVEFCNCYDLDEI